MDLYKWSATAASNDTVSPDGFPEGMAPAGVNNSAIEVMAAVKRGVIIWWATVANMRAITVIPEVTDRHALLITTAGNPARFYQWKATKSGADDGVTIISPTSFSAGAFELIGEAETATQINGVAPSVAGIHRAYTSNTVTTTVTSLANGYTGQEIFLKMNDSLTYLDFAAGSNIKGNSGGVWKGAATDFFWAYFDGTNWNFFCERASATSYTYTIATGIISVYCHKGYAHLVIDTEGAAGTDDLDTINGGVNGDMIICVASNTARDVVFKDDTGNLRLAGDFTLDSAFDTITLLKVGSDWLEMSRSNNGA